MGGLTHAVHWWEESQLRVLVLTSLVIQSFLLFFPFFRTRVIPGWFRFIMWLAYHGGDAVAIYGLATLFNRHKDKEGGVVCGGSGSSNTLEVVWAPVLLIHLGGHDGVTAYNIEDNELWTRHLLTAVSQVTVAVYVFCKSWPPGPGGDKRLLQAAILLFVPGVLKCLAKAWAFKRASIYSLVSSGAGAKKINDGSMYNKLEEYVKEARDIVERHQVKEEEDPGTVMTTSHAWAQLVEMIKKGVLASTFYLRRLLSSSKDEAAEGSSNHPLSRRLRVERQRRRQEEERGEAASKLFLDLSSSYPHRISIFKNFWEQASISGGKRAAYDSMRGGLASAFFLLYTKIKTSFDMDSLNETVKERILVLIQGSRVYLTWASIALFHHSHREAYDDIDVKITYALFCCTAVLEVYSWLILLWAANKGSYRAPSMWPETVHQYSVAGYFVRNKKHSIKMGIVSSVGCKDFLDQLWCMEPCLSSARITHLVLGYLKEGWKQKIQDVASYRSFNNHSSHWGLNKNRPFDECVLLWHLATDFCFFSTSFPDHRCAFAEPEPEPSTSRRKCSQESDECKAVQCRQMSNYMVYLLFVNPEMLLPGTRRNLFTTAYNELKDILRDDWEWNPVCWSRCMPCGVKLIEEEAIVMNRLKTVMTERRAPHRDTVITITQQNSERTSQEESSMGGSNRDKTFIDQAWDLAQDLIKKGEMKMWEEIQDVWVQMLCFSASRCRGYLHAKALGKGGEFLSYVWLLLFYMGMETLSERLQRELLPPPTSTS